MDIILNAEKLGGPGQQGGWQKMARRRYQGGTLRKRGKRTPYWELQWREAYIKADGTIGRRLVPLKIGLVSDLTKRQARKLADEKLRSLNQGFQGPNSTITLQEFVDRYFIPNFFPTIKLSTQKRYRRTLTTHILPAFGKARLCDIGTLEIQRFVLAKMESGLSWECADHYRNLLSRIFDTAKKWGFHSGPNPSAGVELPEKVPVRRKHILELSQIPPLLDVLEEPVRTMVHLALLTGLRIGEILALSWDNVDFTTGHIGITRGYYYYCVINVELHKKDNWRVVGEGPGRWFVGEWQSTRDYAARGEPGDPRGWNLGGSSGVDNPSRPTRAEGEKRFRSATRNP